MSKKRMKFPVQKGKNSAKMPQLVAPVNALDEKTAKTLFENQKVVVEHLIEFSRQVLSIKKDMRKIIMEEVTKQFDDRKIMLEGLYREVLLQKKVLMDKGLITREEINKKYEELKKRK